MKKIITLATLFAVSSFAIAETANTQNTTAPTEQVQTFGGKSFEGKEGKHGERKHDGKHEGKGDRKERGHFFDESTAVKSVSAAQGANDKTFFILEGKIVKQVDDDEFTFRDTAGNEINIDVSDRAWAGQQITPNDNIEIRGKVDKEWGRVELDVKQIIKK